MSPIRIMTLGGCILHAPLNSIAKVNGNFRYARLSHGGPLPATFTFGEMFQLISVLRRERDIPLDIRPLCDIRPAFAPRPGAETLEDVDVALVELSTPVEVVYGPYVVNRSCLTSHIITPLRALRPEAARLTNNWVNKGLMAQNETIRASTAKALIELVPADMPLADLTRDIFENARGVNRDIREGFRKLRTLINRPMGLLTYTYQYLADGRALSWPPDFQDQVVSVATEMGLPVFRPSTLVEQHGVAATLKDDLRHFSDKFLSVAGMTYVEFANAVLDAPPQKAPT